MARISVSHNVSGKSARVSVMQSVDAAEHAGRFEGWNMRMDQMSSGRFSGRIARVQLGDIEIVRETTTQALIKQGSAWPDALVFSVPLGLSDENNFVRVNGRVLGIPNMLLSDGENLEPLVTSPHLDVVMIAITRDRLSSSLGVLGENKAADFVANYRNRSCILLNQPTQLSVLQHDFLQICDHSNRLEKAIGFERTRSSLEEAVVNAFADILSEKNPIYVDGISSQKRIVDQIREYALTNIDDPPSIADLCRHVGVSRRTLQACFQHMLGLSPSQYLRMLRLNAVRRNLQSLAAGGEPVSIGDVAAQWGFWHWSRFTGHYRQLFGELPSQTVQRVASASR